jgi:hypothetical protein
MKTNKPKTLISKDMNRKLSPGGIVVFNLLAGTTCKSACPDCYAMKAQRMYTSARLKREWNLEESKKPDFVRRMVQELQQGHCKMRSIVRFHEAGDFYSQEYVDKVAIIAADCPKKTFYAYTKRLKDFDFSILQAQKNFILIDSTMYGPLNYGDEAQVAAWKAQGALVCPASETISCNNGCDICCSRAYKRVLQGRSVVFLKH